MTMPSYKFGRCSEELQNCFREYMFHINSITRFRRKQSWFAKALERLNFRLSLMCILYIISAKESGGAEQNRLKKFVEQG
jgi:hypothetical protein